MTTTTMDIELSPDQKKAFDASIEFLGSNRPLFTMGGYAGTGKTTILAEIVKAYRKKKKRRDVSVAFCCYTGKAADVLRRKLSAIDAIGPNDYVGTIHGLIYIPIADTNPVEFMRRKEMEYELILIDEASMVNKEVFDDLRGYDVPILAIGDHGQLPPISGSFSLMENPDIRLEKIHRQAEDNPIIKLSMLARTEGRIPHGVFATGVWKISARRAKVFDKLHANNKLKDALVLCGFNYSRVDMNQEIRDRLGYRNPKPMPGEKVICLRNNRDQGIFNGMMGTIVDIEKKSDHYYDSTIDIDGDPLKLRISTHQFGNPKTIDLQQQKRWPFNKKNKTELFDWGYAITVWKAQGSESDVVVVFEQRNRHMTDDEWRRWLYTAVTRSSKELYIVQEVR